MPLTFMEHFLIQAEDIEATKDWYVKVQIGRASCRERV